MDNQFVNLSNNKPEVVDVEVISIPQIQNESSASVISQAKIDLLTETSNQNTTQSEEVKLEAPNSRSNTLCKFVSKEGKRCKRKRQEGNIYCGKCSEVVANMPTIMSKEACIATLMNLNFSVYAVAESMLAGNKKADLTGLTQLFIQEKEQMKEVYEQFVTAYGEKAISESVSPMMALVLVLASQAGRVAVSNKKKHADTEHSQQSKD